MPRRVRTLPRLLLALVLLASQGVVGLRGAENPPPISATPPEDEHGSVTEVGTGSLGSALYPREAPGAGAMRGSGAVHGGRRIGLNPLELYRVSGSADPRAFAEWVGPCNRLDVCWEGAADGENVRLVLFDSMARNLTVSYRWRLSDVTTGDHFQGAENMLNLSWTQGQGQVHLISPRMTAKGTYLLEIVVGASNQFEPAPMSPVMLRLER